MINTDSILFSGEGKVLNILDAREALSKTDRLANELIEGVGNHCFIEVSMENFDGGNLRSLKKAEDQNGLQQITSQVRGLLKLKQLSNILSEGLNLRDNAVKEVENADLAFYCKEKGIEEPKLQDLEDYLKGKGVENPTLPERNFTELTEDEVKQTLDVKKRARMLTLNATAAAIGSNIHPEGAFASAREELMEARTATNEAQALGSTAVITGTRPTVSLDKVNKVFFELQARHRELEAEDNRIKAELKKTIQDDLIAKNEAYQKELEAYKQNLAVYQQATEDYQTNVKTPYLERLAELSEKLEQWRKTELERLDSINIVVPNELQGTLLDVFRSI